MTADIRTGAPPVPGDYAVVVGLTGPNRRMWDGEQWRFMDGAVCSCQAYKWLAPSPPWRLSTLLYKRP